MGHQHGMPRFPRFFPVKGYRESWVGSFLEHSLERLWSADDLDAKMAKSLRPISGRRTNCAAFVYCSNLGFMEEIARCSENNGRQRNQSRPKIGLPASQQQRAIATHTHTHTHTLDVIRDIHRFHTSLIAIHNSYGSAELGRTQLTQVFQRKGLVPICRNSKRSTSTKTCRYCWNRAGPSRFYVVIQ